MTNYPPPSPPYLGPPAHSTPGVNKPVVRIVLHGTVSPCAPGEARETAAYFREESAGGSAHYVVDPGEVVQSAYDSVIAWHAPPNPRSIGVELCDPVGDAKGKPLPLKRWNGKNHQAMLARSAQLVAQLCLAYDIPPVLLSPAQVRLGKRGICEHSDVSQAFHQSTHWDLGTFPRHRFLAMVKVEIAAMTEPVAPAPTEPTRVDKARDLLEAAYRKTKANTARRRRIRAGLDALPKH